MSHLMNTYARQNVAFVRGEGVWLWDEDGRKGGKQDAEGGYPGHFPLPHRFLPSSLPAVFILLETLGV